MPVARQTLLETLTELTNETPERWKKTSSRTCFMFSPRNPAISICNYLDEKNDENINICLIDEKGYTIYDLIINKKFEPHAYEEYFSLYEKIRDIASNNATNEINEAIFKSMVTSYPPPNLSNKM